MSRVLYSKVLYVHPAQRAQIDLGINAVLSVLTETHHRQEVGRRIPRFFRREAAEWLPQPCRRWPRGLWARPGRWRRQGYPRRAGSRAAGHEPPLTRTLSTPREKNICDYIILCSSMPVATVAVVPGSVSVASSMSSVVIDGHLVDSRESGAGAVRWTSMESSESSAAPDGSRRRAFPAFSFGDSD